MDGGTPESDVCRKVASSCELTPSKRALFWSISTSSLSTARPSRTGRWTRPGSRGSLGHFARDRRIVGCPRPKRGTAPGNRPADRSRAARRAAHPGEVAIEDLDQSGRQRLAFLDRLGHDHELREVRRCELLIEREIKRGLPRRRSSRSSRSPVLPRQHLLELLHLCFGRGNDEPSGARDRPSAPGGWRTGRTAAARSGTPRSTRRTAAVATITFLRCATHQAITPRKRR